MNKRDERVTFINLPFVEGIEAVVGANIANRFKRHIHKVYIIGKVSEGERVITHFEGRERIAQGEIFILNPGQVHSCSSARENGHSYHILSVVSEKMQSVARQISEKPENKPCFEKIRYTDNELRDSFDALFRLLEDPLSQLEIESSIVSFLSLLILNYSQSPPEICLIGEQNDAVRRVCAYIDDHFSENLSLHHLASIACLSPFHFQRVFTRIMGISAHDYLAHCRISKAKSMLMASRDIADIAIDTGFVDQSHFSKIFRKIVGIPPGKFVRINKIGG